MYVNHRKAPGAISAIAFMVRPVRPNVACILGSSFAAMGSPFIFHEEVRLGFFLPIMAT
jgi:hypothetical protein